MTNFRLIEFDILRIIATILILLCHIPFFLPNTGIFLDLMSSLNHSGLSLFFVLSGFFIAKNSIFTTTDAIHLIWKKIIRLVPLLVIAVTILFLLIQFNFVTFYYGILPPMSLSTYLINVLNIEIFFKDNILDGFWFISVLFLYFLIYIIVKILSKENFYFFNTSCIFMFIPFYFLYRFEFLHGNFVLYYFVFFFGVMLGLSYFFKEDMFYYSSSMLLLTILILSIFDVIPSMIVFYSMFLFSLFYLIIRLNIYSPTVRSSPIIENVSYSTYSAYLFHVSILSIISIFVSSPFTLILIGFPIVFLFGFFIQLQYDTLITDHFCSIALLNK